jgi:hypothetical protein
LQVFSKLLFLTMEIKEITPEEYAKWWGCHVSYIRRLLLNEQFDKLPNVRRVKKYGRFYVLEVPENLSENSFIDILPQAGLPK